MLKKFTIILILFFYSFLIAEDKKTDPLFTKLEMSYFHTNGNSYVETLSVKTMLIQHIDEKRLFKTKTDGVYSKSRYLVEATDDTEEYYEEGITSHKLYVESEFDYLLSENFFTFVKGDFFDDRFSGYEYRVNVGPGLGLTFQINDKEHIIDLTTRVQYSEDKLEDTKEKTGYASVKFEIKYFWHLDKKTKLNQEFEYQGAFDEEENYFAKTSTGVEFQLTDKISLGSSLQINYQNILPTDGVTRIDKTFLTSLILENIF